LKQFICIQEKKIPSSPSLKKGAKGDFLFPYLNPIQNSLAKVLFEK
jgi:hypothetical protein